MVVGLGTYLVDVDRRGASIERFGPRFLDRVFTPAEQRYAVGRRSGTESLAARFAAKEAGAKALGTGISRGVGWRDLEVVRAPGGPPRLMLHGRAGDRANALGVRRASLSLTHTARYAFAVVVLEGDGGPEML